ncbi:hypothetical protein Bbelb_318710 [Branchiostoma belcheri]|nr:hypothetical protein Bbelb_318710 [Branchiostoma belcheri]
MPSDLDNAMAALEQLFQQSGDTPTYIYPEEVRWVVRARFPEDPIQLHDDGSVDQRASPLCCEPGAIKLVGRRLQDLAWLQALLHQKRLAKSLATSTLLSPDRYRVIYGMAEVIEIANLLNK